MLNTEAKIKTPEITECAAIKATYEALNKRYRRNHRELEKNVSSLNKMFDELENTDSPARAVEMLTKVMDGIAGTKRKAETIFKEENKLVLCCKSRLEHINRISLSDKKIKSTGGDVDTSESGKLKAVYGETADYIDSESGSSFIRLQRHIADHLFTTGYPWAALRLAKGTLGLADLCLTELYEEAVLIEDALSEGDTGPAHVWLQEANFKLKKNESTFEFDLRVFEFYLLVREGKRIEAIKHARKHMSFVKAPNDYRATKLGQTMILLAMRTSEEIQTKAEHNNLTEKWIVKRAHEVLLDFYGFPNYYTLFQLIVNAGISVIKTHQCYDPETKNRDCAVCHPLINRMAIHLPFGRHDHSVLNCYQTGLPMNEHNPPMSLPNGYVYSEKGITELTGPDGVVTCPRSGQQFPLSQIQRVFIL